jgi:hypothetical protein
VRNTKRRHNSPWEEDDRNRPPKLEKKWGNVTSRIARKFYSGWMDHRSKIRWIGIIGATVPRRSTATVMTRRYNSAVSIGAWSGNKGSPRQRRGDKRKGERVVAHTAIRQNRAESYLSAREMRCALRQHMRWTEWTSWHQLVSRFDTIE